MIIGINGPIGSGKDTLGQAIQYVDWCNNVNSSDLPDFEMWKEGGGRGSDWQIKKYATKLKQIAGLLLGVDPSKFENQEYKNSVLGPEWNWIEHRYCGTNALGKVCTDNIEHQMTVREFLQFLGTDAMRDNLHSNVWVNALMADYKEGDNWIITDCRFPNEAEAIKEKGGIVVRVNRINNPYPKSDHISETALNDWKFDHKFSMGEGFEGPLLAAQQLLEKI